MLPNSLIDTPPTPFQSSARFERSFSVKDIGALQYLRHLTQLLATVFANGKLLGLASTGTHSIQCSDQPFA